LHIDVVYTFYPNLTNYFITAAFDYDMNSKACGFSRKNRQKKGCKDYLSDMWMSSEEEGPDE
jgi:hypothetical protein